MGLVHGMLAKNQWIESNYVDEKGHVVKNQWVGNRYVDEKRIHG